MLQYIIRYKEEMEIYLKGNCRLNQRHSTKRYVELEAILE